MARKIAIDVAGSSCVARAEYDPKRCVLQIGYVEGDTYDYQGVPPGIAQAFAAADSKGQFVNTEIKPRFSYRKRA
jgi:hypothetical protein